MILWLKGEFNFNITLCAGPIRDLGFVFGLLYLPVKVEVGLILYSGMLVSSFKVDCMGLHGQLLKLIFRFKDIHDLGGQFLGFGTLKHTTGSVIALWLFSDPCF